VKKVIPKTPAERTFLKASVTGIFLFSDLSGSLLDDVIDAMERKAVAAGERLMAQGQEGDNFYVVQSGNFEALKDGKTVYEYLGHGFFGELALMYNTRRQATVEARTAGVVWALDRLTFRHILTITQQQRTKMSQEALAKVSVLSSLSKADLLRLGDALMPCEYQDGETVIRQGAYGDTVFIIEEGSAMAYQEAVVPTAGSSSAAPTERREVFQHGPGDYFGERALLTDEPRAATVVARGNLKVGAEPCWGLVGRRLAERGLAGGKLAGREQPA
jgi:cAMP-dependent protein kinase regulator